MSNIYWRGRGPVVGWSGDAESIEPEDTEATEPEEQTTLPLGTAVTNSDENQAVSVTVEAIPQGSFLIEPGTLRAIQPWPAPRCVRCGEWFNGGNSKIPKSLQELCHDCRTELLLKRIEKLEERILLLDEFDYRNFIEEK